MIRITQDKFEPVHTVDLPRTTDYTQVNERTLRKFTAEAGSVIVPSPAE